ncbi:hypothetical protein ACFX1R_042491 [Malus domestica]
MDSTEVKQLERVNSLPNVKLASTSWSVSLSSVLTSEDNRSATSSDKVSQMMTSRSGEILALLVPSLVDPALSTIEKVKVAVTRSKCVGKNNKGVTWSFTSVIGKR